MVETLSWKTSYDGRQLSMEDYHGLQTYFNERLPLMKDVRQPLMEGELQLRKEVMEDNLW